MKIKLKSKLIDKFTKEVYKAGQVIDLPKDRAEDVIKRKLAVKLEKKEGKPKKSKKED